MGFSKSSQAGAGLDWGVGLDMVSSIINKKANSISATCATVFQKVQSRLEQSAQVKFFPAQVGVFDEALMHDLTVRMKDLVRCRRFIGGEFQGKVALARIGIQTQGGSGIQIIEGTSVKAHPPTGGIRLCDEILKVFVDCGMGCLWLFCH